MICIKRVYEPAETRDGIRMLVDRLWPRGIRKEELRLDSWNKDVAPSNELRKWFNHAPDRWEEFRKRYFAELESNPAAWNSLEESARSHDLTLLYSAKDKEHNNAEALRDYLDSKLRE